MKKQGLSLPSGPRENNFPMYITKYLSCMGDIHTDRLSWLIFWRFALHDIKLSEYLLPQQMICWKFYRCGSIVIHVKSINLQRLSSEFDAQSESVWFSIFNIHVHYNGTIIVCQIYVRVADILLVLYYMKQTNRRTVLVLKRYEHYSHCKSCNPFLMRKNLIALFEQH